MSRGPGAIPDRWLYCPRKSETLIVDKFLAFKTPLKDDYDSQMPIECCFSPDMIFQIMKTYKVKIGLWIDLTNTNRFYDRGEIEDNGCQYVKLQCRGHGETPTKEQTSSFIEIVDEFNKDHPLEVVGVHCTHGFNRTGFLIVAYMVERLDCAVDAALKEFAEARPPGIYKEDYIRELFRRYGSGEEEMFVPQLPEWCLEYDDSNNTQDSECRFGYEQGNAEKSHAGGAKRTLEESANQTAESAGGSKHKKRRKEFVNKNAKFMDGVRGVTHLTDQPRLGQLQKMVQKMCHWQSNGFPGCQPVSMNNTNLQYLQKVPYKVSWKADGTRYMMLIVDKNEIYFFDRDNSCFEVSGLDFPHRQDLHKHVTNTLVDGEMVIDKVNGNDIPRYLVYDIVRYEDNPIDEKNFYPDRADCIKKCLIVPRQEAMKRGIIDQSRQPFSVRFKEFWDITHAEALLGPKFAKALAHEPDGLIFQPTKKPYVSGVCQEVLKWKPPSLNSIDFRLKIEVEHGLGIVRGKIGSLYVGGLDRPIAQIKLTRQLRDLNNKIIECKFQNNEWIFMRERTDKSFPNSYDTAKNVYDSIAFPVTKDILLNFIHEKGYKEKNISN